MKHEHGAFWECGGYTVIDCQSCGFKHVYPIPSQNDLKKFYEEEYYKNVKPVSYNNITDEQLEKIKSKTISDELYKNVYDKVMQLNSSLSCCMVDIGCGTRLLSHYFKNMGWKEYIIEPSKEAGEYLRRFDLNVINETVEEVNLASFQEISFINLQFVLEHLANPLEVLRKAYQLLAPGGIIRVCVPNDFSDGHMAYMEHFNEKPRWVCLPDHINYFNFESLSNVMGKIGFVEVYRTTDFPLELLLMSGMNYYASSEEKQKVGPFIENFQESLVQTGRQKTLHNFYETLAKAGFGRSIYMYAMKPL